MPKDTFENEIVNAMYQHLLKIATTPDHDRLEAHLKDLATRAGFKTDVTFGGKDTGKPDVLRTNGANGTVLLIADAKVAPHDIPARAATKAQISGYIESFAKSAYKDAILAIATNTADAGGEWVAALPKWARNAALAPGNFTLVQGPRDTWTAIGGVSRSIVATQPSARPKAKR
jgi:hypothetical protein